MDPKPIRIKGWKRAASFPFFVLALFLRLLNQFRRARYQRVLVLEPVGMGDLITSEPLIRELSRAGFEVLVASSASWRGLVEPRGNVIWREVWAPWGNPDSKAKYVLRNYTGRRFWGPFFGIRKLAPGCTGIDPRGDIRIVLFLYLAGCKRVISLASYVGSNLSIPAWVAETVPFDNIPRWKLNLRFLSKLVPHVKITAIDPPILTHLIQPQTRDRIAFIPIAPWEGKWWASDRWVALAHKFQEEGHAVVALCGPGQAALTAQQVQQKMPVIECHSMEEWARELNRSMLVISVDSGPMHFADGLRIPLIALFGQGYLPFWQPNGPRSVTLSHQHEDPEFMVCHQIEENVPLGRKMMDRITVSEVLAAAQNLLVPPAAP